MQAFARQGVEVAYLAHHASLVRHLTIVTRDADAAQDLAHEALLRLAGSLEAGAGPDDVGAWLHRVGMNLAMSRGRRLQVANRRSADLPLPDSSGDPEAIVVEAELTRAVANVLSQLPLPERDALVLAAHGYNGAEIAATIGRTPAATRTMLCRARGKIRERVLAAGFSPA